MIDAWEEGLVYETSLGCDVIARESYIQDSAGPLCQIVSLFGDVPVTTYKEAVAGYIHLHT